MNAKIKLIVINLILLFGMALCSLAAPPHPNKVFRLDPITGKLTLKPGVNLAPYMNMDSARENCQLQPDGIEYVLVLKVDFPDQHGRRKGAEIDRYFFAEDDVSLKSYYRENSYGQMNIEPGPLGGCMPKGNAWYRVSKEMSYYGEGIYLVDRYRELTREACELADADVDFSQYDRDKDGYVDHLFILHAGNDEASSDSPDDIWSLLVPNVGGGTFDYSVRIDASIMVGEEPGFKKPHLGIYFHEFLHDFGAPDMYGANRYIEPLDQKWCLMGMFGPYQGGGDERDGLSPSHISSYLKWDIDARPENGRCGWIEPVDIKENISNLQVHSFELPLADNKTYKITVPGKNGREFFLISNRNKSASKFYDIALPESGILIWHIDENKQRGNTDASNRVWLEDPFDPEHLDTQHITDGAAYSADDNQNSFTPDTNPNSNANDGSPSGITITNIGREGLYIPISVFFGDTYEPNDDLLSASGPLEHGIPYESFIYDENDQADYYKFEAEVGVPITILLRDIPENADYTMRLLNFRGDVLAYSTVKWGGEGTIIYRPTKAETLYIVVESRSGYSNVDSYILLVNSAKKAPGFLKLDKIYCYPNPAKANKPIFFSYTIPESPSPDEVSPIPEEIRLEVFTINGELVYSTEDTTISGGLRWDGKNKRGSTVASGMYIYVISAGRDGEEEFRSVHKLAIER